MDDLNNGAIASVLLSFGSRRRGAFFLSNYFAVQSNGAEAIG
jgi:hypothetical protein